MVRIKDMYKPKILIIDDEQFYIELLVELLTPQYQAVVALGGEQAVEIALFEPHPDLILLDVVMPGMDGYEVCQKLKADPRTLAIPVIFLTLKSSIKDEIHGFDLGAVDYIIKPISPPILRARIATHIALNKVREEAINDAKHLEDKTRAQEIQLKNSNERLRNLIGRLQIVREEERKQIAHDVHDDLGQTLTALKIDMAWCRDHLGDNGVLIEHTTSMIDAIDRAADRVRDISSSLRPPVLDDFGLGAAVEWMVKGAEKRTHIKIQLAADDLDDSFDERTRIAVFRIIQESLTNMIRHSGADQASIQFGTCDEGLMVTIVDNGTGIPIASLESPFSIGLIGMRERAQAIGGDLSIARGDENGTVVTLKIPVRTNQAKME